MKKLLCIFLAASSVCFSYSIDVDTNLNKAWEFSRDNEWVKSLEFLTGLIENPDVPNIDKVHYLWRRHHIYAVFHDIKMYSADLLLLDELIKNDDNCADEAKYFYQYR